jgi:hydrogenase maturation protease
VKRIRSIGILGAGSTRMGDDGIGIVAVRSLASSYSLPQHIRLYEGAAGSFRLLAEIDQIREIIIVDAAYGGGSPGVIYRMDSETIPDRSGGMRSPHQAGISEMLHLARALGADQRATIIGVEPQDARTEGLELSPAVRRAVPAVVSSVVTELRAIGVRGIRKKRCDVHHAERKRSAGVSHDTPG